MIIQFLGPILFFQFDRCPWKRTEQRFDVEMRPISNRGYGTRNISPGPMCPARDAADESMPSATHRGIFDFGKNTDACRLNRLESAINKYIDHTAIAPLQPARRQWCRLAAVLDRLFLFVYLLATGLGLMYLFP